MIVVYGYSRKLATEVEIQSDGRTCWVNAPSGDCIGRWSPLGTDVHRTVSEQMEGRPQCLDCEPHASWERFRESMATHYGVDVPASLILDAAG